MVGKKVVSTLLFLFLILVIPFSVFSQEDTATIDYNRVYRFPASLGLEAQISTPLTLFGTDYGGKFSFLDISALGRFPLKNTPMLQPLGRLGFIVIRGDEGNEAYDSTRIYLTGGLGYAHKFNKKFEIGADVEAGVGYSIYPELFDEETYAEWNVQGVVGGRVAFNPTYNFSIDLKPALRYFHSFSPLSKFNGFSVSIGLTGHYRFGTDPDDPRAEIKSIEFDKPQINDMFAAMQSYYVDNPAGEVVLHNTEKYALTDLEVSFYQPGYMNLATPLGTLEVLDPGESWTVPITAQYDQRVFEMSGVTPLTGEIQVDYTLRTRTASQTVPVNYDLYDKNTITWDDDRKVAAFITSGDSALGNYVSFLRQSCKDMTVDNYSEALQTGMQVFYGLSEIGCLYQRDPTLSFEDAQVNATMVDSVNLPRETLTKLAGDCDDLTVLYNAMIESAGIETGFITIPGHIYSMFSTGIPSKDYALIHPDKNMTIPIEGVLWVPVEITFIGSDSADFDDAWRAGADEFARFVDEEDALSLYFTREAQTTYRPVGFKEGDLGLQYGSSTAVARDFRDALDSATRRVIDDYERIARERNTKGDWNRLGIVSALYEEYDTAEKAFYSALSLDRNYLSPKINLANVYYKREEFQNALRLYHEAEQRLREVGKEGSSIYSRLLLNISKTYFEVENYDQATLYSDQLSQSNPELADRYAYLADGGGARAADVSAGSDIMFIEE